MTEQNDGMDESRRGGGEGEVKGQQKTRGDGCQPKDFFFLTKVFDVVTATSETVFRLLFRDFYYKDIGATWQDD